MGVVGYNNKTTECLGCGLPPVIYAYFTLAIRAQWKQGFANAIDIETILTDPPHGMTGWYGVGTYVEHWELLDVSGSGTPPVVGTEDVGYDWAYQGDLIVENFADKDIQITPFGALSAPGPGEIWVMDSSELINLGAEVDKAQMVAFITDLTDKPFVPVGEVPFFPVSGGYEAEAATGLAIYLEWKPQLIPEGLFDDIPDIVVKNPLIGTPDPQTGVYTSGDFNGTPDTGGQTIPWNGATFWEGEDWIPLPFGEGTAGYAEVDPDNDPVLCGRATHVSLSQP